MTTRGTWKNFERYLACLFGTERTPLSGGASRHTRSDTLHEKLFIEAKYRVRHTVITLIEKVEKLAKKENKIPVLALRNKGSHKIYLVIEIKDFIAVAKEIYDK